MSRPTSVYQSTNAPSLFQGAANYYSKYRPGYPDSVFDYLIGRFALGSGTYILDLGCGTGQVAIPFAERGIPVNAVDPDTDMLCEGIRVEAGRGVLGVCWRHGDDGSLEKLFLPPLTLCVMGASFHWTNRDTLLHKLEQLLIPTGAIIFLDGGVSVWDGLNDWQIATREVIIEFLGPQRRAGSTTYSHPEDRHEIVLARSAFRHVEQVSFDAKRTYSIEDIVGQQLSSSYASPAQLGPNVEKFKNVLRDRLAPLTSTGFFEISATQQMILATRVY
jgi:SAM-dependent methyltransferase